MFLSISSRWSRFYNDWLTSITIGQLIVLELFGTTKTKITNFIIQNKAVYRGKCLKNAFFAEIWKNSGLLLKTRNIAVNE